MSENHPVYRLVDDRIEIRFPVEKRGLLARLTQANARARTFGHVPDDQKELLFAIADLRAWGDQHEGEVDISDEHILISHDAAANLGAGAAQALGLPQDVHLTLRTDVAGTLGSPEFRLLYEWSNAGRRESPRRQGAFLETADGPRRLPLWMKRAMDLADGFDAHAPVEEHWKVLAEFRRALEPDETMLELLPQNRGMAGLAMTSFLRGLEVRIANSFSISPDATLGQFEIVPYSSRHLSDRALADGGVSEVDAELSGEALAAFQYRVNALGARPAYQLGNNSYVVIEQSSAPVLEALVQAQKADRETRKAVIRNPRAFITEAVARHLQQSGALEQLDAAGQEEMIESVAGPAFVESREYSARVTGVVVYEKPSRPIEGSGTTWLPEVFSPPVAEAVSKMATPDLEALHDRMKAASESGKATLVEIAGENVEVTPERLAAVGAVLANRLEEEVRASDGDALDTLDNDEKPAGPIILDTLDNSEDIAWHADLRPRAPTIACEVPDSIVTKLRQHQMDSFDWATRAWRSGLPGILNADEQGLGKTLQTISFLNWLQKHMQQPQAKMRGPIMVVAPTSLLVNWEEEVERHVEARKFGHLVRLYGSSLSGHKVSGAKATEAASGLPLLDLEWLDEAFEEGRAHRYWFLTTYTTLANYQHSLGRVAFSAMVFDEIQNIKNKDTIASKAVEAMNVDFRIGLTGTPIENTTMDLWTIMDRLVPGALGAGKAFRASYGVPNEENMTELHARVFKPQLDRPPLALRRLKDEVATDLPRKDRLLHPRVMPQVQSAAYDAARIKKIQGGPGAALKSLHHIRSVSVHPGFPGSLGPEEFVAMSARLSAVMRVLEGIKAKSERALVFIEHREMQFRFAELARHFFGLNRVDIINGDTPIPKRQTIVNHFQRHLEHDGGFDLLVLGPKAAGTGLTLTAATHVIHLSRWWNPAVEEQCNDRVHRIGQTRPVQVHVPLAIHPGYREGSFDCLLNSLMQRKRKMASQALWPMGDTQADLEGLQHGLDAGPKDPAGNVISDSMSAMFAREGVPDIIPDASGTYRLP